MSPDHLRQRRVVHSFPTTSGLAVELCQLDDGRLVIVKRPLPGQTDRVRRGLMAQAEHFEALELLAPAGIYPEVLGLVGNELVLVYVEGASLREVASSRDPDSVLDPLADAVTVVFDLVRGAPGGAPPGTGFLAGELRRRATRISEVLETTARGRRLAQVLAPGQRSGPLDRITGWLADGVVARVDRALAPPRLGLAAHGDLTPQNVVVAVEPDGTSSPVHLIDVRGLVMWCDGLPWWDPMFDVAAAAVFHGAIGRLGMLDVPSLADAVDRTLGHLLARCEQHPAFTSWAAEDRAWRARLDVAVAARLLGNVSVQLEHGGNAAVERAAVVHGVLAAWFDRVADVVAAVTGPRSRDRVIR